MAALISPLGRMALKAPTCRSIHDLIFKHADESNVYPCFAKAVDDKYRQICICKPEMDALFDATLSKHFPAFCVTSGLSSIDLGAIFHWALDLKEIDPQNPNCTISKYWKTKGDKWRRSDVLTFDPTAIQAPDTSTVPQPFRTEAVEDIKTFLDVSPDLLRNLIEEDEALAETYRDIYPKLLGDDDDEDGDDEDEDEGDEDENEDEGDDDDKPEDLGPR